MNNNLILWSMFFIPWLTLFFMKKEDIKRYMPVGLLAIVTTTIIHDVGLTLGFWVVLENAFPFHQMLPYFYGNLPVLSMWIFKFTYGRFWLYVITNVVFDIVFAFGLLAYFFPARGIYELVRISSFGVLGINIVHMLILYGYQLWQDDVFARSERTSFSSKLHPAAAKLTSKDDGKED